MLIPNNSFKSTIIYLFLCIIMVIMFACGEKTKTVKKQQVKSKLFFPCAKVATTDSFCLVYEKTLKDAEFVNLKEFDSSIAIALKYASTLNFMHSNLYRGCSICYVHPQTAIKLKNAQTYVKAASKNISIVIYDVTRPSCIQQLMWDSAKMNLEDKRKFLANPKNHSLHNYGLAVDCGLIDETGNLLDMGTEFDYAGEKAYPCLEKELLAKGILTKQQIENRKLLRSAMLKAGFTLNAFEWWHFNVCNRILAEKQFVRIVDFSTFVRPVKETVEIDNSQTDIVYKVQLVALPKLQDNNSEMFKGLNVEWYKQDNYFKYTVGKCASFQSAFDLKDSVAQLGFPQAFVVCFKGNQRISIKDISQ
jgi:zinc D-Ala-D-Ala dipeptidase